jgi:hypothetical protein
LDAYQPLKAIQIFGESVKIGGGWTRLRIMIGPCCALISTFYSFCRKMEAFKLTYSSSVGIALGYGLDDRGSRVRFPEGAGNFSLHHRVQTGSGTHPDTYPMGTRVSFPGDKAVRA